MKWDSGLPACDVSPNTSEETFQDTIVNLSSTKDVLTSIKLVLCHRLHTTFEVHVNFSKPHGVMVITFANDTLQVLVEHHIRYNIYK